MNKRMREMEQQIAEQATHLCHYCRRWAWSAFVERAEEHQAPCVWPQAARGLGPVPDVKLPPGLEIKRPLMKWRDDGRGCPVFLRYSDAGPMPEPPQKEGT